MREKVLIPVFKNMMLTAKNSFKRSNFKNLPDKSSILRSLFIHKTIKPHLRQGVDVA